MEVTRDRYTAGKLTALTVKRIRKRGMHGNGFGLYLQVAEGGSKSWVLRFKVNGRPRHFGSDRYTASTSRKPASVPPMRVGFCSTVTIQSLHDIPPVLLPISAAPTSRSMNASAVHQGTSCRMEERRACRAMDVDAEDVTSSGFRRFRRRQSIPDS